MSESTDRLESALSAAVARMTGEECPPRLAEAIRHAVFPAGGRLRPRLCYAVADALGERDGALTDGAAVAIEFLHGASLVQDDLPAFDDAVTRRGRAAVHRIHGEALAVLASDALIIGAFDTVARLAGSHPHAAGLLALTLARGSGTPFGAVAGQAWESEPSVSLRRYHRAKTAALFESATAAGAIAAGADPEPWRACGSWLGRAYQLADDLSDAGSSQEHGSDAALGRPNAVQQHGVHRTGELFDAYTRRATDAIPSCAGRTRLRELFRQMAQRLRPLILVRSRPRTVGAGTPWRQAAMQ